MLEWLAFFTETDLTWLGFGFVIVCYLLRATFCLILEQCWFYMHYNELQLNWLRFKKFIRCFQWESTLLLFITHLLVTANIFVELTFFIIVRNIITSDSKITRINFLYVKMCMHTIVILLFSLGYTGKSFGYFCKRSLNSFLRHEMILEITVIYCIKARRYTGLWWYCWYWMKLNCKKLGLFLKNKLIDTTWFQRVNSASRGLCCYIILGICRSDRGR